MAMQELNQAEVAEVSGAGLAEILGNIPFALAGSPIFLLGLIGTYNYATLINTFYGNPGSPY